MENTPTMYKGYRIEWNIQGVSVCSPELRKFGVYGYTSERKVMNHIDRLIKQGKIDARA